MKTHLSRVFAVLLPITSALAQDGVLHLSTRKIDRPVDPQLSRRGSTDNSVDIRLNNQVSAYMASISVGTPGQKLDVLLDTGSSDLWVPDASACDISCPDGTFNTNHSSSYTATEKGDFFIEYGDGMTAKGDWFTDNLKIGDVTLKNFSMGLGSELKKRSSGMSDIQGVLGIGYRKSKTKNGRLYANFPQALVDQGIIKSPVYSLWLDDRSANTGSILFGGVDTSKFIGKLHVIDILSDSNNLSVPLTSIYADDKKITSNKSSALLDSGTSLIIAPSDVYQEIANQFSVVDSQVPCSQRKKKSHIIFSLGQSNQSVDIKVDISQLIIPVAGTKDICQFGMQAWNESTYILGDTFLRSAYVVYDLHNNKTALAPASFRPGTSKVISIPDEGASIPEVNGTGKAGKPNSAGALRAPEMSCRMLVGSLLGSALSTLMIFVF